MSAVLQAQEPRAGYLAALQPPLVRQFDLLATAPGGVARLRELILTLAVQGKLVAQDPSDEPASVLLQKVRAEKDRLIAAGKIKPDRASPAISNEDAPFALPQGWACARLPDLSTITGGSTPSKAVAEYWTGNIPWVSPKDMKVALIADAQDHVSDLALKGSLSLIQTGSLLMVVRGMILAHSFPVAKTAAPVTINQDMKALTPLVPELLPFLSLVCQGMKPVILGLVDRSTHGTCKLESPKIFGLVMPFPPLAEQSRIVTRVKELMRLCDALESQRQLETAQHAQLLSTLLGTLTDSTSPDELAANWQRVSDHFDLLLDRPEAVDSLEQTILQLAVRGLLVPQDPSDEPAGVLLKLIAQERERQLLDGLVKRDKKLPDITTAEVPREIPPGWAWVRLGSIANFIDYRGKTPTKTETGVPLITAKNVRQGYIHREPREFIAESAYTGWMTRGFPRMGDILFTTEAPLGNVAIVDIDESFALAQRVICLSIYEVKMSEMLSIILQSPWMQKVLAEQASGVTAQGIKSARLQLIYIPVPPLAEQTRIVARVTLLRSLCADLRKRLNFRQTTQRHLAEAMVEI